MSAVVGILAEDELPQRVELRRMLAQLWPELHLHECDDGVAALECLAEVRPQVVFLDIRMPGIGGLEVAKAIDSSAQIVFTTAYDEYAVQAFERGAIDYVLKPIKLERLTLAVHRVRERLRTGASPNVAAVVTALERRLAVQRQSRGIKWITAALGSTTRMFAVEDVLFFQAQDKYTRVVTQTDEAIIRMPLKELLDGLDADLFWQVHRSAIVRVGAIQAVQRREDGRLELRVRGRDEVLPVSSAFHYRFRGM